jgi:hypothetical protein
LPVGTSQDIGISNENLLSICFDRLFPSLALAQESTEKPEVPVNNWARKEFCSSVRTRTVLLSRGTLAKLAGTQKSKWLRAFLALPRSICARLR